MAMIFSAICYANYKSNIYLDERFMLCIYDSDTFHVPYKKYEPQNIPKIKSQKINERYTLLNQFY